MGFSLDISVPVLTVFFSGPDQFLLSLRAAADTVIHRVSVRGNGKPRRRRKDLL